jgi:hypothetical protein
LVQGYIGSALVTALGSSFLDIRDGFTISVRSTFTGYLRLINQNHIHLFGGNMPLEHVAILGFTLIGTMFWIALLISDVITQKIPKFFIGFGVLLLNISTVYLTLGSLEHINIVEGSLISSIGAFLVGIIAGACAIVYVLFTSVWVFLYLKLDKVKFYKLKS